MCPWYCSCTHIHSSVWLCCFLQHRNRKHAATDGKSPPGAWPKLLGVKRCLHLCWTKTTQSNKNPLRAGTPVTIKSSVTQAPSITHSFCGEWAISLLQLKLQLWELSPGEVCASVNMPADVLFIWIKHLEPTSVTMARELGYTLDSSPAKLRAPLGSKKVPKLYTKWNHISAAFIFATATCKFIFADKQVVSSPCIYLSRCKIKSTSFIGYVRWNSHSREIPVHFSWYNAGVGDFSVFLHRMLYILVHRQLRRVDQVDVGRFMSAHIM